jgi:cytochrome c oxidase subunit 1
MGAGGAFFIWNIIVSAARGKKAEGDAWFGEGRTLEWSIPSPAPEYNFAQTPLVKGVDTFWLEKREGNQKVTPAEPLGEIHMPNNSILPLIISVGAFIAGFGFIYSADSKWTLWIAAAGLAIMFGSMLVHSLYDDHGRHVIPDELKQTEKRRSKGAEV